MTATSDRTATAPARSAQRVVEGAQVQGVRRIFGIPGGKVDEVFDVFDDLGPELIVCRHEQNAAFMAGAIGRLTDVPGVVLVTSGPGTSQPPTSPRSATSSTASLAPSRCWLPLSPLPPT
jgi:acetolactate synthase I/II/III large subunit